MKNKIMLMTKEEIVDFLSENWTDVTRLLPEKRVQEFFNLHPVDLLREIALGLVD